MTNNDDDRRAAADVVFDAMKGGLNWSAPTTSMRQRGPPPPHRAGMSNGRSWFARNAKEKAAIQTAWTKLRATLNAPAAAAMAGSLTEPPSPRCASRWCRRAGRGGCGGLWRLTRPEKLTRGNSAAMMRQPATSTGERAASIAPYTPSPPRRQRGKGDGPR